MVPFEIGLGSWFLQIIAHIENEIYVQFDKDTQNVDDRRYLFVCDRSQSSSSLFHGTVRPGQTVIVQ